MTYTTLWTNRYYLGKNDGQDIYISPPSWDCGWYWGFGYLGNRRCHYHLSGIENGPRLNMYDALVAHFKEDFIFQPSIEQDKYHNELWTFCELARTAYSLKETAEVLGHGGSFFTTNPLADVIKNPEEVKRINENLLPTIFNEMNVILALVTALHES